jgi:NAD(P)-dependent dehydrogenase (short-subunit alcohol dehydrogenase family)
LGGITVNASSLAGKPVIITGAARGLGRGYALHLAGLGACVVVNDRDEQAHAVAEEARSAGGRAISVVGSVSDWDFAGELVARAVAEYGSLYGLVANAGVYHVVAAPQESAEQIRMSIDSNLIGTMHAGIHAMRHMVAAGAGVIVTTTSSAALGLAEASTYSAAKGAIMSLTYSWAIDLQGSGVRVNCVRPRALTRMSVVRGAPRPGARAPEEVAPLVAYLLDDRSARCNGPVFGFDGERLELVARARPVALATPPDWSLDAIAAVVEPAMSTVDS